MSYKRGGLRGRRIRHFIIINIKDSILRFGVGEVNEDLKTTR